MSGAAPNTLRSLLAFLIAGAISLAAGDALAQIPPVQWQLLSTGAVDVELGDVQAEAQVNLAAYGIGLALGLGGEALRRGDDGWDGGGYLHLAIQLRPLMLAAAVRETYRPAYFHFDPHLDVGGLLGAVSDQGEGAVFRGQLYVGAALDFGISTGWYPMARQVVITLGYRFVPIQGPGEMAHLLVVGVGYRGGY